MKTTISSKGLTMVVCNFHNYGIACDWVDIDTVLNGDLQC